MTNQTNKEHFLLVAKDILGFKESIIPNKLKGKGIQSFTLYKTGYYTGLLAPKNLYKLKQVGFKPTVVRNSLTNPYYKFITGIIQ